MARSRSIRGRAGAFLLVGLGLLFLAAVVVFAALFIFAAIFFGLFLLIGLPLFLLGLLVALPFVLLLLVCLGIAWAVGRPAYRW